MNRVLYLNTIGLDGNKAVRSGQHLGVIAVHRVKPTFAHWLTSCKLSLVVKLEVVLRQVGKQFCTTNLCSAVRSSIEVFILTHNFGLN